MRAGHVDDLRRIPPAAGEAGVGGHGAVRPAIAASAASCAVELKGAAPR
jgi:hypothetical protein